MFTGLVEQCSEVVEHSVGSQGHRLAVRVHNLALVAGESIALNGVCLTVVADSHALACFDVSPETLAVTNLSALSVGDKVNIERSLKANSRLGGHYVTGHVDTTALVQAARELGEYIELTVAGFAASARPFLLPKGSITLDGVSLTINAVEADTIRLLLVPHTLEQTTFRTVHIGQRVNVEFDYFARLVAHQLGYWRDSTILSSSFIQSGQVPDHDSEVES